eukprot:scaffold2991_cov250-Pinguiococcus_pyrenoidosus.AAC.4
MLDECFRVSFPTSRQTATQDSLAHLLARQAAGATRAAASATIGYPDPTREGHRASDTRGTPARASPAALALRHRRCKRASASPWASSCARASWAVAYPHMQHLRHLSQLHACSSPRASHRQNAQ